MKDSKKLRFIDRYLGSTICAAFSVLNKFKRKKSKEKIKNVLVIELFEMGAAIMIHPSLDYIKKNLDDPNIYCLTLKSMRDSWELLNIIPKENIYTIEEKNMFVFAKSLLSNIIKLRKKKIDLVLDFELFMRIPAIISFMIKSKYRAGFYKYEFEKLYRGTFYDFKCVFNQNTHISKNFLSLTKTALLFEQKYPNYKGSIKLSELTTANYKSDKKLREGIIAKIKAIYPKFDQKTQKVILVCPDVGGNLSVRNYPKEKFVTVINSLLEDKKDYLVLLIGIKDNLPTCDYIQKNVANTRCINFCSKTYSVKEAFELLSMSDLLITNDNGPAHFAAVTKTDVLAIFSTDSPFIYGPLGNCVIIYDFFHCSPCIMAYNHKQSKCKNNLCIQSIEPKRIVDTAKKIMDKKVNFKTINNEIPYLE